MINSELSKNTKEYSDKGLEVIAVLNNSKFLPIERQGTVFYGGSQSWWRDEFPNISKYGCGVIAMCNTELYFGAGDTFSSQCKVYNRIPQNNQELAASDEDSICDFRGGNISSDDYIKYVYQRYNNAYRFFKHEPFSKMGLFPWTMRKGIRQYFKNCNKICKARWTPTINKKKILSYIERMLNNDIPIPASYYVFNKNNKLDFYVFDKDELTMRKENSCTSHYFNITGIVRLKNNGKNEDFLIISSWGKEYYILLNKWVDKLSYFTNIMYLEII